MASDVVNTTFWTPPDKQWRAAGTWLCATCSIAGNHHQSTSWHLKPIDGDHLIGDILADPWLASLDRPAGKVTIGIFEYGEWLGIRSPAVQKTPGVSLAGCQGPVLFDIVNACFVFFRNGYVGFQLVKVNMPMAIQTAGGSNEVAIMTEIDTKNPARQRR